jgi:hypothetical protein
MDSRGLHLLMKIPPVLADLAIMVALLAEATRRWGRRAGLLAAALYGFNPAAVYVSAFWGQSDALPALAILVALLAVERGKAAAGAAAGMVGVLTKPLTLAVGPVLLVGVLRNGGARGALVAASAGLVTVLVVLSPFLLAGTAGDAIARTGGLMGVDSRVTAGAPNLHYLLTGAATLWPRVGDATEVGLGVTFRGLGLGLFAAWACVVAILAWRSGDPNRLILGSVLCSLGWFLLMTEIHERHLFAALPLLALLAAGDGRYRPALLALTLAFSLNLFLALQANEQPVGMLDGARRLFSEGLTREPGVGVAMAVVYAGVAAQLLVALGRSSVAAVERRERLGAQVAAG